MNNLEYIENYFKSSLLPEERSAFEDKILNDPAFAQDVAFYIATLQAAKSLGDKERRERFEQLHANTVINKQGKVISLRRFVLYAAACLLPVALLIGWLFMKPVSTEKLASEYIDNNFKTLGVNMGSRDSMQNGLQLFNAGRLQEAMIIFEAIYKNDTTNDVAEKYAGIAALRLGNYDKAIERFEDLLHKNLYANPAKFYLALTLLKRNQPGDKEKAHVLLKEVLEQNLDGRDIAAQWLKKF